MWDYQQALRPIPKRRSVESATFLSASWQICRLDRAIANALIILILESNAIPMRYSQLFTPSIVFSLLYYQV